MVHLAMQLVVIPVTIYNRERGNNEPYVSRCRQLARRFDVSMVNLAPTSEGRRTADAAAP